MLAKQIKLSDRAEATVLDQIVVRLIEPQEQERWDQLVCQHHYLQNARLVGEQLRYVVEYEGQWLALLGWAAAAYHIRARDQWIGWNDNQRRARLRLVANNARFCLLTELGQYPNLASRAMGLNLGRLARDWQDQFGHPVLLVETFVDPQRFRGTCYKAANWELLGATQGFQRCGQDYYLDVHHPKELWVYPLGRQALERLRAPVLDAALEAGGGAPPPPAPVKTAQMSALAGFLRQRLTDPRDPHGVRHPIVGVVALATLAIAAGCQGPHAIFEFAQSLNHGQRRRLGCRRRPGQRRQFDVPCQRTFERLFQAIDPDELRRSYADWMASLDPAPLTVLHLDGKVVRNADPAPPRLAVDPALAQAAAALDTPVESQKPKAEKALTLVNFQTPGQRLIDQIAVPQDTNEEAAVAAHLLQMDLTGVLVVGDAAHTVKANCRRLTQ